MALVRIVAQCIAWAVMTMLMAPGSPSSTAAAEAPDKTVTVVDLSKDLPKNDAAMASSPGAATIAAVAASDPFVRAAVVLEKGRVVAEYVREGVDPDAPFHVWSSTKSWMNLLLGLMVDGELLSVDETLGEIFANASSAWDDTDAESLEFRKAVTIREILTMTSGLRSPPGEDPTVPGVEIKQEDFEQLLVDGGGSSLSSSLAHPLIGPKGEFSYLGISNILSYVVKERMGVTPRQYLAEKVMPHLGIAEDKYGWLQNEDGVEFGYHGLELTPLQMAKFGQLYQQGGVIGNDEGLRLVSQGWIDDSFKRHSTNPKNDAGYGYLFWNAFFHCAIGAFGQDICILPHLQRVVVQQRDPDYENINEGSFTLTFVANNSSLSFNAPSGDAEDSAPQSGGGADDSSAGAIGGVAAWILAIPPLLASVLH